MTTLTKTIEINTQSIVIPEETGIVDAHLLPFNYVETLRHLLSARIKSFAETKDFSHYKQANILRRTINNIVKG